MVQPISGRAPVRREEEEPTTVREGRPRERVDYASREAAALARVAAFQPRCKVEEAYSTPTTRIQAKLDHYMAAASGPYFAEGLNVRAAPHFRMVGGFNEPLAKSHCAELRKICAHALPRPIDPMGVMQGRGTAEELVAVTQALIDAGKLPPGKPEDLALRIHRMQWEWGIGFDCAGYAQEAFLHARGADRGRYGLNQAVNENLAHLAERARFVKVSPTDARAGDIVSLAAGAGDTVGHAVIVRDHEVLSAKKAGELRLASPEKRDFLRGGPIHRYEVDSSWGAGTGHDYGGVRRDEWLFNESTKEWGFVARAVDVDGTQTSFFVVSRVGPCDHPIDGFFRPKDEV